MGYNADDQIIYAPVGFHDVQQALGITNEHLKELCTDSHINMWSPRKPIYSTKVIPLDNDDWKNPRTLTGYKTGAGIKKYCCSGTDYLAEVTTNGYVNSHVWEYDKPVLDGLCAFRDSDFSGYWHTATRKFAITMIYGNIENIRIPSSDSGTGSNIGFSMYFQKETGQIIPEDLFGDCWDNFYPGVILTSGYGDSNKFHYVKTTSNPVSSYLNNTATISIPTADFATQIAKDWLARYSSGDPYSSAPLRTGDYWTGCLVLLSRAFGGGDGNDHKLISSDTVIRLEYSQGVDRKTLPIKQSKWDNIDWMKMSVTLSSVAGYTKRFKIQSITVTAKLLASTTVSFPTIKAELSVVQGTVNVQGVTSGQNIEVANYSSVSFTGNAGDEVTMTLGISETTYDITATGTGNMLCNGALYFMNSEGTFRGGWSIDTDQTYMASNIEIL